MAKKRCGKTTPLVYLKSSWNTVIEQSLSVYNTLIKQLPYTIYRESFDVWNFQGHSPFAVKLLRQSKYRGALHKLATFFALLHWKKCYIQACTNCCKESTDHAIMSSSLLIDSKICGFYVYFEIWEPYIREEFLCKIEEDNDHDPYAFSMMKWRQIVGHVLPSISRAFAVHLRSHGAVTCTVTGGHEYSSDLEQGGL